MQVSLCFVWLVTPFCKGHGHLPSECFGAGKKYELLPEDDGCELFVCKCSLRQGGTVEVLTSRFFMTSGAHSLGSQMALNHSCA